MTKHIMKPEDTLSVEILQDLSHGFTLAGAEPLNLSAGISTIPTADFINQIERRLDALAGQSPPQGWQGTKTWRGGNGDNNWLDFSDINRWFNNLEILINKGRT